jgi:uncharacterized protein YkvS
VLCLEAQMTLTGVKVGDIVKCDLGGRIFYAEVAEKIERALVINPITHNVNYRQVKASQVKGHWRKSKAKA